MTKEQQELYEKLLKKVNEFCLGFAAEDVIAAIDALVDTYETKVDPASEPLEALERIIETFIDKDSEDIKIVRNTLKALEIIKKKPYVVEIDYQYSYEKWVELIENEYEKHPELPTKEEYQLLKEIFPNESTN